MRCSCVSKNASAVRSQWSRATGVEHLRRFAGLFLEALKLGVLAVHRAAPCQRVQLPVKALVRGRCAGRRREGRRGALPQCAPGHALKKRVPLQVAKICGTYTHAPHTWRHRCPSLRRHSVSCAMHHTLGIIAGHRRVNTAERVPPKLFQACTDACFYGCVQVNFTVCS